MIKTALFLLMTSSLALASGQADQAPKNKPVRHKVIQPGTKAPAVAKDKFFDTIFTHEKVVLLQKILDIFNEQQLETLKKGAALKENVDMDVKTLNATLKNIERSLREKLGGTWTVQPFSDEKIIAGIIAVNKEGHCLLIYPGTRFEEMQNANVKIVKFGSTKNPYYAHQGFYTIFMKSWPGIKTQLESYAKKYGKQFKIVTIGFSRGGASANLAALLIKEELGLDVRVITFGAPAVFDEATAKRFDTIIGKENSIRFTVTPAEASYEKNKIEGFDKVPLLTSNKLMPFYHSGIKISLPVKLRADTKKEFEWYKATFGRAVGAHFFYTEALEQFGQNHKDVNGAFSEALKEGATREKKDVVSKGVLSAPSRVVLGMAGKNMTK